jgi:hypothetical protein
MALHEPASAEALAALCAVEFCKDVGIQYIILEVEGDPLQVAEIWTYYRRCA